LFRLDSCSRNVYRYEDLKDSVVLEKIKDHYIFTVESVGAIKPHELVSTLALNLFRIRTILGSCLG
jgi:hypothetical protein